MKLKIIGVTVYVPENAARWHMARAPIQTASEAAIERRRAGVSVHGLASEARRVWRPR